MENLTFTTLAEAKRKTGLTYLGNTNTNAKTVKNMKIGQLTYILYLAPAQLSGFNVCPMATKECIAGCLNSSGRALMDKSHAMMQNSRIKKTKLFFEQREFFMRWLLAEIESAKLKAEKLGLGFSARLNGTSDLDWSVYKIDGKNVYEHFPNVTFYDYTKLPKKVKNAVNIPNYHLTFSYSGYNWDSCNEAMKLGNNVAVIFDLKKSQPFPKTFNGIKVINGDETDFRPYDGGGVIVGLRFKKVRGNNEIIKNSPLVIKV